MTPPHLVDRDIVLLGSAPWQTPGPLNCHHIAQRLAADNRVLYIESPGLRTPSLASGSDLHRIARRLRSWVRERWCGPTEVAPNLHTIAPLIAPFHGRSRPGGARIEKTNRQMFRRAVARGVKALDFRDPILWSFLPVGCWLLDDNGKEKFAATVYHCVDDYAGNPGVDTESARDQEAALAAAADVIFATSAPLAAQLATITDRDIVTVPNVAEAERFLTSPTKPEPTDLAEVPHPRAGFVGNLAGYKVDLELLREVAARLPHVHFVLVGPEGSGDPDTDLRTLRQLDNVHLLGARDYAHIPAYVHAFDACLIPFRRALVTDASFPLKTFEYLATGKPVVATQLASLASAELGEVVSFADGADAFVTAVQEAVTDTDPQRRAARQERARRESWDVRFPQISQRVAQSLALSR